MLSNRRARQTEAAKITSPYAGSFSAYIVQSQAIHFNETLTLKKNLTLDGGYDCDFSPQKIGNSSIHGTSSPSLLIDTGSVISDSMVIE